MQKSEKVKKDLVGFIYILKKATKKCRKGWSECAEPAALSHLADIKFTQDDFIPEHLATQQLLHHQTWKAV